MSPLRPPAVPTEHTSSPAGPVDDGGIAAGTRLGKFVVLERVGAGGMGTVFLAYDAELDRRVAIKLLHRSDSEAGGPEAARERLLQEAQAMARLQHPNVVTILQTGVWEDRVFLAMEYVDGDTLRSWLAAEGRTAKERLDALLDAGRGLAAAHAAGLIHRDFKPDNVLVGKDGRARVTDFGLASRLGEEPPRPHSGEIPDLPEEGESTDSSAGSTQQGSLVGTPAYMAPEQLMGQPADERSDQFAFAVTVWEAYAGRRPYDLDGLRQLAISQLMIERGQVAPSSRGKTGPGVGTLLAPAGMPLYIHRALLRALTVDPARRHPTMEALLVRLSNDPRIRRRQWAFRLGALALAVAGVAALVVQQGQARAARCTGGAESMAAVWGGRERGALEQAFLGVGGPDAADQVTRTGTALDAYANDWAQMYHEACTATRVRAVQSEEVLELRVSCLERRRKELASLVGLLRAPDAGLVDRAPQAVRALPDVQVCADVEALKAPVQLPADPGLRAGIRRAEDGLAHLEALRVAGRLKDGGAEANTLWAAVEPLDHAPTSAEALFFRGLFEASNGKRDEAIQSLTQAVLFADRGRTDDNRARASLWLARIFTAQNRLEDAELWLRLGRAAVERTGGNVVRIASLMHEQDARLNQARGRYAEALAAWERATRAVEQERGRDAPELAPSLSSAANLLIRLGRSAEAIPRLQRSLRLIETERGADHVALIAPLAAIATQQTEARDFPAALANVERALSIARLRFGAGSINVADLLDYKATALQARGSYEDSLAIYRESLRMRQELLPADSPDLSYSYDGIGQSLLGLERHAEARAALEQALRLRGPDPFDRAETGFALARALWPERRERPRAKALANRAVADYAQAERADKAGAVRAWLASMSP